jgi:hypothetical protein
MRRRSRFFWIQTGSLYRVLVNSSTTARIPRELLKQGREDIVKARKDGARLASARAAFAAATEELQEAKKVLGAEVDADLKSAFRESESAAKAVRPLDIEFRSPKDLKGWSFEKGEWAFRSRDEQKWFQPNEVAATTLSSPRIAFPRDFQMEIYFGLMGPERDFRNGYFSAAAEPVIIRLVSREGFPDFTIAMGKDRSLRNQNSAGIAVGKKSYAIESVAKSKGPIVLRLIRHRGSASLEVGETTIPPFELTDDFVQIVIVTNSPQDFKKRFVAPGFFKLSVKAYELAAEKSSRLPAVPDGAEPGLAAAQLQTADWRWHGLLNRGR